MIEYVDFYDAKLLTGSFLRNPLNRVNFKGKFEYERHEK